MTSNEQAARTFLQALRRVSRQVALYPRGHPSMDEAVAGAEEAANDLSESGAETMMTISGDMFYQDRVLLPHSSLEYNGLLRDMRNRGVESLAVTAPVSEADVFDLASFISGVADDLPVDGTVRLNAVPVEEEGDGNPVSRLRRSYAGSLAAIRTASTHLAGEGAFEMSGIVDSVEGLLDSTVHLAGAALLLSTMKSHDGYTFYHSVNTTLLSLGLGTILGLDREELIGLGAGSLLHDIGKISVSSRTLKHPGRLSDDQWRQIEIHPREGAQAILAAGGEGSDIAALVAFEHHLRFDGGGYPRLARPRRPHVLSRIVTVTDVYDSITSRRPYRRAETPNRALRILLDGAGSAYDPDAVKVFIAMLGLYPPGSILRMRNGDIAVVTFSDAHNADHPHAIIVNESDGDPGSEEEIVLDPGEVEAQLLPEQVGFDPAALLERIADVGLPTELAIA